MNLEEEEQENILIFNLIFFYSNNSFTEIEILCKSNVS